MDRDENAGLYVISVAAELAGVHPQTLRLYERKGLLEPARTDGGNRRYSERDLARLRHIGELTANGVNLQGVRRILELEHALEATRAELERTRRAAAEAVERTHRQYRRELVPYQPAPIPPVPPALPAPPATFPRNWGSWPPTAPTAPAPTTPSGTVRTGTPPTGPSG